MIQHCELESDVLILGAGLAGCVAALSLANKGVSVVLVTTTSLQQEHKVSTESEGLLLVPEDGNLKQSAEFLLSSSDGLACPRATEHLIAAGNGAIKEFLIKELGIGFDTDHTGAFATYEEPGASGIQLLRVRDTTGRVLIDALLEKLRALSSVTILDNHSAVDLLTLGRHSTKLGDRYRKPTCCGAVLLDHAAQRICPCLAKETVLATGSSGQLFLHSTSAAHGRGEGISLAHRAGARLLHLDLLQLHPLAFAAPNVPLYRLPEALRYRGGELLSKRGTPFLERWHEAGSSAPGQLVSEAAYCELLASGSDHLWLDLRQADLSWLQGQYPSLFSLWQSQGLDVASDLVPVLPAVDFCSGGVAVDRVGQTTVHRLRAVGQVACTGVHGKQRLPGVATLESIVWGMTCAADIAKEVGKFAYYMPSVQVERVIPEVDSLAEQQDWQTLKQLMWSSLVNSQRSRRRIQGALHDLLWEEERSPSLRNALTSALLITGTGTL